MTDENTIPEGSRDIGANEGLQAALYDGGPEPRAGTPYLKIFGPDIGAFEFELPNRTISVGRSEDTDIMLPNRGVSRVHARIACGMGQFTLEDAESTSGTAVNGRTCERHVLEHGDCVEIGTYVLQFRTHREIPGADEAAARAKMLLRSDFCTLPSSMRIKYRTLVLGASDVFASGDTLEIGTGGMLIPTATPPDDGSCLELDLSISRRIRRQFLGELMGVIEESAADWMCVKLHTLSPERHKSVVADAEPGPWRDVVPT